MGSYSERTENVNGRWVFDFSASNNFRITNTFFPHKEIHKYTWCTRGPQSIIDYVLVNRNNGIQWEIQELLEDVTLSLTIFFSYQRLLFLVSGGREHLHSASTPNKLLSTSTPRG